MMVVFPEDAVAIQQISQRQSFHLAPSLCAVATRCVWLGWSTNEAVWQAFSYRRCLLLLCYAMNP